jgi:hypothetical protein
MAALQPCARRRALSLARPHSLHHPIWITNLAAKYDKTPAPVILRWHIEHDVVAIPKSVKPHRIKENFDVFDFELTADEVASIDAMVRRGRRFESVRGLCKSTARRLFSSFPFRSTCSWPQVRWVWSTLWSSQFGRRVTTALQRTENGPLAFSNQAIWKWLARVPPLLSAARGAERYCALRASICRYRTSWRSKMAAISSQLKPISNRRVISTNARSWYVRATSSAPCAASSRFPGSRCVS